MEPLPKLLDVCCCEGGASMGYSRAGLDVYGLDLFNEYNQKRYPFPSYKGDAMLAMELLLAGESLLFNSGQLLGLADFALYAASPPCQAYSISQHTHSKQHPELIVPIRRLLRATGAPYVIENVPGAPLIDPLILCGTEFDLTAKDDVDGHPLHLKRHRLFESNFPLKGAGGCRCIEFRKRGISVGGVYGGASGDRKHAREVRKGGYTPSKKVREKLIGADWMTLKGLSQSIPPAYTEHIGRQALEYIRA